MKRILIVVDYQNDFVNGSLGFAQAAEIEDKIASLIGEYRKSGDVVAFTLDTHSKDYRLCAEGKKLPVEHCVKGTAGHELYGAVKRLRRPDDPVFIKNTFGSDKLYEYLKRTPFDKITLVGLVCDVCVIANAVLAKTAAPETDIAVRSDCVASLSPARKAAALSVMDSLHITVESNA